MQSKISVPLLSALSLSRLAFAQDPVPLFGIGGDQAQCGGCYAVAGVAGIVFGTDVVTATQINGMIAGANTTFFTSIPIDTATFTINSTQPAGPIPTDIQGQTSFNLQGSTFVLNGVTLTSPTAYNVFTAYSTTTTTLGPDGSCSIILGSAIPISPAIQIPIPADISDAAGFSSFQIQAEQDFFRSIGGFPNGCSGGGISINPTTQVSVTTVDVTMTLNRTLTPAPASVSATPTPTPTSTAIATTSSVVTSDVGTGSIIQPSIFSNASFTVPSAGQNTIVIAPSTVSIASTVTNLIIPGGANRQSALGGLLSGVLAMIVGFAA